MRKIKKCAVLLALIMVASVALMAVPQDGLGVARWCGLLVASKAVCAVCAVAAWKLYNRWSGTLGVLDRLMQESEEG